jgi:hypothetical protein
VDNEGSRRGHRGHNSNDGYDNDEYGDFRHDMADPGIVDARGLVHRYACAIYASDRELL